MESFFISKRKRKMIDNDFIASSDEEEYKKVTKKDYKTRSSRRNDKADMIANNSKISPLLFMTLPLELRHMIAQYSFNAAYLLECHSLLKILRPKPLIISLEVFRQFTRALQPVLSFYFDDKWTVTFIDDTDKIIEHIYKNEFEFRKGLLSLLLTEFLFVTNDRINIKYKYDFDVYLSSQPFKILDFDPKFNEFDIYNLVNLYLGCIDSFDLCLSDNRDYYMHQIPEVHKMASPWSGMGFEWIISKKNNRLEIYKVFRIAKVTVSYYTCQYGTVDDVKDLAFVKVIGATKKPKEYKNSINGIEAVRDMMTNY